MREYSGDFLQWLQTFRVVVETGSIHKSALLLHRSPSTISLQIKKLENELSRTLFKRVPSGMEILPEALRLHEMSKAALDMLEGLRDTLENEELRGLIVISSLQRHATDFLLQCVKRFHRRHPKVKFIIHATSYDRVFQQVDNYDVNFGVSIAYDIPPNLQYTECYTSPLYLVMPKGNPYGITAESSWDDICDLPFIAGTPHGPVHPWLSRVSGLKQPSNVVMAMEDSSLAIAYVRAGLGACISADPATQAPLSELTVMPLDRFLPLLSVGVLQRKEGFLSPHAKAFFLNALHVGELYTRQMRHLGLGLEDIDKIDSPPCSG